MVPDFVKALFCAFALWPVQTASVQAGQPISESMVECSVILNLTNRQFPERGRTEKGEKLAHASAQFLKGAMDEARREGRTGIATYLAVTEQRKTEAWDQKGLRVVFTEEFRDWMSYCNALARDRGLDLK